MKNKFKIDDNTMTAIFLIVVLTFGLLIFGANIQHSQRQIAEIHNVQTEKPIGYSQETEPEMKAIDMVMNIQYEYSIKNVYDYAESMNAASIKYNVPVSHIYAVILTESGFDEKAKSSAGAIGPMQIIPKHWESSEYDPKVFHENIMLGAFILNKYKKKCGDTWECAFKSYNVGITNYRNKKKLKAQERYWTKIKKHL